MHAFKPGSIKDPYTHTIGIWVDVGVDDRVDVGFDDRVGVDGVDVWVDVWVDGVDVWVDVWVDGVDVDVEVEVEVDVVGVIDGVFFE